MDHNLSQSHAPQVSCSFKEISSWDNLKSNVPLDNTGKGNAYFQNAHV